MADVSKSELNAFYKDKSIFITGGSGFMGKVLIEKLLYSCSDLKEIFILMRPKKGRVPESRLEDMFKLPVSFHSISLMFQLTLVVLITVSSS